MILDPYDPLLTSNQVFMAQFPCVATIGKYSLILSKISNQELLTDTQQNIARFTLVIVTVRHYLCCMCLTLWELGLKWQNLLKRRKQV